MGSINRVVLMGTIGQHPELKTSINGKPYVRLSLATYRRTKDEAGHSRRDTQWHKIMLWGKNAELCSTFCSKGSPLYIEGHLASYTKEERGTKTFHLGIVAEQIQFIPGTRVSDAAERGEEDFLEPGPVLHAEATSQGGTSPASFGQLN
ncbi:MAG: single-stranded DNA-binding protein [Bdellovibrionales bacterium]|nr:single-stranded DNA-binding protein [Bdellovibrionales bacterium]